MVPSALADLALSGAGQFKAHDIRATTFSLTNSGATSVELAGEVDALTVTLKEN